jgi:hypothetical protein
MTLKIQLILLTLFISFSALANKPGRIVQKSGKVELYINPSKKITGTGPHVLYEGEYFTVVSDPKLGYKIPNNSIVKTGAKAKAKIIFPDGDQFNVGEATSFRYSWQTSGKTKGDQSTVGVIFGKIRAVVSKDGPRNNMQVKTPSAVMGVRGTDFFISQPGQAKSTSLAVIRGKVEMKSMKPNSKPVEVPSGFTAEAKAEVKPKFEQKVSEVVESVQTVKLELTSKEELTVIQKESVIKKEEMSEKDLKADKSVVKEIAALEKKAVETTLSDIKTYDPKLYEKLKQENIASVDNINTKVVKKKLEAAPSRPLKPGWDDLKEIGDDAYERYFKMQ